MRAFIAAVLLCIAAVAAAQPTERAVRFAAHGLTFEAMLTEPAPAAEPRWGVLLIGGGLASDLDWRIPAEVAADASARGDAALLAEALAQRGAVVLRWSTLALEDPLRDRYPREATPRTYAELLAQARAAAGTLAREGRIEGNRVLLVAHSLGAVRALDIAQGEPRIAGIALLCGARLVRTGATKEQEGALRQQAAAFIANADRDRSGALDAAELAAAAPQVAFTTADRDGSGALAKWEVLAEIARRNAPVPAVPGAAMPWGEDLAAGSAAPVLCVVGGLDEMQGAQSVLFAERLGARATLRCLPGLGHTLGKEAAGRIAPIDRAALDVVAEWAAERMRAAE